jgi:hypothetical protein
MKSVAQAFDLADARSRQQRQHGRRMPDAEGRARGVAVGFQRQPTSASG